MRSPTFSEAYCRLHDIPADRFERAVLARALYPHARLLAPFIRMLWPQHFAADLDLVRGAGQLRRVRDFSLETLDYSHHPANQGGLRRLFRLRASTQRLRRILVGTLHNDASSAPHMPDGTDVPFSVQPKPGSSPVDEPRHS